MLDNNTENRSWTSYINALSTSIAPRPKILVVGSAHVDVYGDTNKDNPTIDKKGKASFFIGGTAFNIATNVAMSKKKVYLFTYLKKGSIISEAIVEAAKRNGVKSKFICLNNKVGESYLTESAFIAHRCETSKDLISAVSGMAVGEVKFFDIPSEAKRISKAIRSCSIAVLDCNLSPSSLVQIIKACETQNKPVMIAGVSQEKLYQYTALQRDALTTTKPVEIIHSNLKEILYALRNFSTDEPELVSVSDELETIFSNPQSGPLSVTLRGKLCNFFNANSISITDRHGVLLLSTSDCHFWKPDIDKQNIKTTTGAGDSLFSCLIETYSNFLRNKSQENFVSYVKQIDIKKRSERNLARTLSYVGATPNAALTFVPAEIDERRGLASRLWLKAKKAVIGVVIEDGFKIGLGFLAGLAISYLW